MSIAYLNNSEDIGEYLDRINVEIAKIQKGKQYIYCKNKDIYYI